ncbi:hypothetical protein ACN47E_007953 [Coniothyrium glycines]
MIHQSVTSISLPYSCGHSSISSEHDPQASREDTFEASVQAHVISFNHTAGLVTWRSILQLGAQEKQSHYIQSFAHAVSLLRAKSIGAEAESHRSTIGEKQERLTGFSSIIESKGHAQSNPHLPS